MKDKLYKNHYSGFVYRIKRFFVCLAIVSSLGTAVAVPTYILVKEEPLHTVSEDDKKQDDNNLEKPMLTMY